jgi:hypothetical protein
MHIIRLRGPWDVINPESGAICRVQWPLTLSALPAPLAAGRLTVQRKFHRPTGIEPHDVVALQVLSIIPVVAASLNASPLSIGAPGDSVEVTKLLQAHNLLSIQLQMDCGLIEDLAKSMLDVQLEITP